MLDKKPKTLKKSPSLSKGEKVVKKTVKKVSIKHNTKKEDLEIQAHKDKFLFNFFVFIAILTVFNFCLYVFDDSKNISKNLVKNSTVNIADVVESDSNKYSENGISFSYPKNSTMKKNSDSITVDNWGIYFYGKGSNYKDFDSWFNSFFKSPSCSSLFLNTNKDANLSYSMYLVDGDKCSKSGIYMVGDSKVAKIDLNGNPNNSYEEVLASLKF